MHKSPPNTVIPPNINSRESTHWNKMSTPAITNIDIQGKLPKVASGKVRDLYAIDDDTLLFVASDRISAYDVIMENVDKHSPTFKRLD
jgi:phosphoribosylaminoimidazole-succinocarboxamide synthase